MICPVRYIMYFLFFECRWTIYQPSKMQKKGFGQSIFSKSKMDILKCPFSISQFTFA